MVAATESASIPAAAPPRLAVAVADKALTTRGLDFWLLGGASVVVWALLCATTGLRGSWAVAHHFENLPAFAATLSLVCNFPHFMASYKLAYERGPRFVARHGLQLVVGPLVIAGVILWAYRAYATPEADAGAFVRLGDAMRVIGLETPVGRSATVGQELLALVTAVTFLAVGWHYGKQVYGAMMVYAHYDGYALDSRQKALVRWSIHGIWIVSWLHGNFRLGDRVFHGATLALWIGSVLAIGWFVIARNRRERGKYPSATFVVPYVAFVVWWLPLLGQTDYVIYLVPFFHALQYLTFVHKVERTHLVTKHPRSARARGALLALALIVTGFAAFELLPNLLDRRLDTATRLGTWFFLGAVTLFLNLHHYLIDSVIWRFHHRETRDYLLA